jgi:pimeloyl-ACP methyl ester carboxylesterase
LRFWHRRRAPGLVADLHGAGQAMVLLHGQPGNAADWEAVGEDLAVDHRVIVPDRLGYGRTGGRAAGFTANAAAVVKLMDQLGEGKAIVVGHSWAGGVALQMALDFPARVAGLGLVASVAPDEPLSPMDRLLARRAVGTVLAAVTLSAAGPLLATAPARAFAKRHSNGRREPPSALGSSWHRPSTWSSFATEQRALFYELPHLSGRLGSIDLPATVLVGSADRVVGANAGNRLASALPHACLEVIDGAGHLLPQLEPAAVAAALRRLAARAARA